MGESLKFKVLWKHFARNCLRTFFCRRTSIRHIRSMASTKEVATKGMMSVSQGQCAQMANMSAAVETKNISQYNPLRFLLTSMDFKFVAKVGEKGEIWKGSGS